MSHARAARPGRPGLEYGFCGQLPGPERDQPTPQRTLSVRPEDWAQVGRLWPGTLLSCLATQLKSETVASQRDIQSGSHASDNAKGESQAASQRVADIGQPLNKS